MEAICPVYGVACENEKKMNIHIRQVHDERKFKCPVCGKLIESAMKLRAHEQSHKVKSCDECMLQFPVNSLKAHMKRSPSPNKRRKLIEHVVHVSIL